MQDFYLERRILTSVPTLQHAVVGFPVPPPEGFPEARGLCSLITFLDGDLAAAVKAGFQRTTAKKQCVRLRGHNLTPDKWKTEVCTHCSLILLAAVHATSRVCT